MHIAVKILLGILAFIFIAFILLTIISIFLVKSAGNVVAGTMEKINENQNQNVIDPNKVDKPNVPTEHWRR